MTSSSPLTVRTITAAEHRTYISSRPAVPLEQTPGWARGFVTVRSESVGWFDNDLLIGAGLFRYRGLPRLPMRSVAVFDSGPDIDWTGVRRPRLTLAHWLDPLVDHLRDRGVFSARVNPVIARQGWSGVTPDQKSESVALVPHVATPDTSDYTRCSERLAEGRWRPMSSGGAQFTADVSLSPKSDSKEDQTPSTATGLVPGIALRVGTMEDIPAVQEALRRAHPHLRPPSAAEIESRWRGLASDNIAGVQLIVAERHGEVIYGGLVAVVGGRAWDLSPTLPVRDADLPEVVATRAHTMRVAADLGARRLVIPTAKTHQDATIPAPAPGWPPARLRELTGTWHYPVRATWHAALSPIVDRLVL